MFEPITAIQEILKAAVANVASPLYGIKKVYFGDPVLIPESSLPAVTISPKSDNYVRRGSRYDQKEHSIEIRLIYNQKDFFGKEGTDAEKVSVIEDALLKVGETTTHATDALTICGLIQKNNTLQYVGGYAADDARVTGVTYSLTSVRGFPTYEAIVEVLVTVIGDR